MYNTSALLRATTFLLLIISFFTTTTSNNTFSTTPSPPSTVTVIDGRWPPLPPPALWIVVIVVLLLCTCSLLCGACCCDWCQCIGSVVFSPVESAGLKIEAGDKEEVVSVKGVVLRRSGSIRLSAQVASPARRTKTTMTPQKNNCRLFSPLNEVFFGAATCPQSQKSLQSAAVRRRRSASLKRCKVGSLKVDKRAGSGKVVVVGHRKGQRSTSSATSRAAAASRRRRLSPAASSSSSFSTASQSKS